MDKEILEKVNANIYSQFPYLKNTLPQITKREDGCFNLVYKAQVETESKFSLPVIVRVVADNLGKIKKLSTSR